MTDEAFFAFASQPQAIGQIIHAAVETAGRRGMLVHPWTDNDISGKPLSTPIFLGIDDAPFVIADVTRPNFNVYFEIGYGIGRKKKVYLVSNTGIERDPGLPSEIGIFDTLGYLPYQTEAELVEHLWGMRSADTLDIDFPQDRKSPIYIIEPDVHTQEMTTIISAIKKRARIRYRSFNPSEHIRISATEAIQNVASSAGVIIPLLSKQYTKSDTHNLRCAFVAGLAVGMDIPTLILSEKGEVVPLDVRDLATRYNTPRHIQVHLANFIPRVVERLQDAEGEQAAAGRTNLTELQIGDPAAENEMLTLGRYYLRTDAYESALRGDVNLILGRKGMGKTALFAQLRDRVRKNKANVVIDLKPEGYQLVRLKEEVLKFVTEGTRAHLVTALWEYVIYLEICYKLLEKDEETHKRDHRLFDMYRALSDAYNSHSRVEQGDFSERLYDLSASIRRRFELIERGDEPLRLRSADITQLLYLHDLHVLRDTVAAYLTSKEAIWILFDNLDKGWPAQGIGADEIVIIRCLIDAAKKIQRDLSKRSIEAHNIIFVRNDIFELLMSEATDFGKESRASLDWFGNDFLREMVRLRLSKGQKGTFEESWGKYFVSHLRGEDSYFHIEQRSLKRPRNLIKIISHCRGNAIVRGLERIDEDSIDSGLTEFSNDIIVEADREISDVQPKAKKLLYKFMREPSQLKRSRVIELIKLGLNGDDEQRGVADSIFSFLLYFGFLGVVNHLGEEEYVYDFNYNMSAMEAAVEKLGADCSYCIHPAFWPALKIVQTQ